MYDANKNLIDTRELLKIKRDTLLAETLLIRRAEAKQKAFGKRVALPDPFLLNKMRNHRVWVVRKQSRLTGLALGFIRGRNLPAMENYPKNHMLLGIEWEAIGKMVRQYGSKESFRHFEEQRRLYSSLSEPYATRPKLERTVKA